MRFDPATESRHFSSPDGGLELNDMLGIRAAASSVVLPNKAGLTNSMALLRYEAMVTSVTIPQALARLKNVKRWGFKHLRLAHRITFEPVYSWAGNIRTVNIRKQDRFADKDSIELSAERVFRKFYETHGGQDNLVSNLSSLSSELFSLAFAQLYSDLNLVHPFLEGNGRTLKTVLTAMARQTRYDFKWERIAAKKWNFDTACIEAGRGDISRLADLFAEVREPLDVSRCVPPQIRKQAAVQLAP